MTDSTTATPPLAPLSATTRALVDTFDTALFDLDGVVYVGAKAVPGAPEHIRQARERGLRVCFVTNNASRPPDAVVEHLGRVGVPAVPEDVVTSAQAAAGLVAQRVPAGSRVLVVGGEGLVVALRERDLVPVFSASDAPVAVVQGFHPDIGWRQLAEGAYALAADLPWVASNVDLTLPTDGGLAPGNGTLVEVLRLATGRTPVIAGKPALPLFAEAVARAGATRSLVIGDRLDTDIEGAHTAGLASLLVLTGVTGLSDLVTAPPHQRPTYVAETLDGLFESHRAPELAPGGGARCGGWRVELRPGSPGHEQVVLTGDGRPLDGVRAVLAAAWTSADPATIEAAEVLDRLRGLTQAMS